MTDKAIAIKSETDLKLVLHKNYMTQIKNFFGDEKQAMKFLSSVMASVQKTPKLIECEGGSLINSFMTMAQLGLMPSDVSGEAYVLPYNVQGSMKAQFQLGYQGLVTLFYRAGGTGIRAEIVRKNDKFSLINGKIEHEIDIMRSNKDRGEVVGAYAIAIVNGEEISKAMNIDDIMAFGKKFSKSFDSKYSPWNTENDPEGWMYKKTVLKQLAKLLPKNETIYKALEEDNQDSRISDVKKMVDKNDISMGNFLKDGKEKNKAKNETEQDESQEIADSENTIQQGE
jgi:recombination protein RecT